VGGRCELTVEGLEPNQTYVFAVAAYGSQGVLLGNAIGQTTRPTLASIPLPTLSTWALLAQVYTRHIYVHTYIQTKFPLQSTLLFRQRLRRSSTPWLRGRAVSCGTTSPGVAQSLRAALRPTWQPLGELLYINSRDPRSKRDCSDVHQNVRPKWPTSLCHERNKGN